MSSINYGLNHGLDLNYSGEDKIIYTNFKHDSKYDFSFLPLVEMARCQVYGLAFVTLFLTTMIAVILCITLGYTVVCLFYLSYFLVMSCTTKELIRYARVKKAIHLRNRGFSENEILNKMVISEDSAEMMDMILFTLLCSVILIISIT